MTLPGKIVLITGAGRGIGKAIALSLAKSGCRVALTARTADQLGQVAGEIRASGGEAFVVAADLARDEDLRGVVDQTHAQWGPIDILINNAGWGKRAPVIKADIADWDRTFSVNLRAPMVLTKLLLPDMLGKGEGAVINIGSVSGRSGEANGSAYSASKFGLIGFTESLFDEVRENGIKVAVILPGFVDTPLIPPNRHLDRSKMIQAEDVAETVRFVLSSPQTACPVEILLRPQRTPYRSG